MAYLTTGVILYSINTKILEILIRQCLSFERVTCLTNLQLQQMYSPKCDAWCPDDAWCPSATTVREYYNAANTICADVLEWRMPDDQEGLP